MVGGVPAEVSVMRRRGAFPVGLLTGALLLTAPSALLAQPQPQQQERGGMGLTQEEARTVEQATLADPRIREILRTDRPRLVSVTAVPDKAEAGAFLSGASAAAPS